MEKEIRVTIFYSSERIFNVMHNGNNLKELFIWAAKFFNNYGFILKIHPFPNNFQLYKKTFVLENDNSKEIKPLMDDPKIAENFKKRKLLDEELKNASITNQVLIRQKMIDINKDTIRIYETFFAQQLELRSIAHTKYRDDYPLKKPARLPIIICEYSDSVKTLGYSKFKTVGYTVVNPIWLPFVTVDISAPLSTVAHEIIHAAGHPHPIEGGEFDGPETSLMNYKSQGLPISEVKLEDLDLQILKNAYFVVT